MGCAIFCNFKIDPVMNETGPVLNPISREGFACLCWSYVRIPYSLVHRSLPSNSCVLHSFRWILPVHCVMYRSLKILLIKHLCNIGWSISSYKNGTPHYRILEVNRLRLDKCQVAQVSGGANSTAPLKPPNWNNDYKIIKRSFLNTNPSPLVDRNCFRDIWSRCYKTFYGAPL
jgi:hypothetical protein